MFEAAGAHERVIDDCQIVPGLVQSGANSVEAPNGTLIWMVAIDPAKAAAGQDPSVAAFALPFQNLNTSNHIAQGTEEIVTLF